MCEFPYNFYNFLTLNISNPGKRKIEIAFVDFDGLNILAKICYLLLKLVFLCHTICGTCASHTCL